MATNRTINQVMDRDPTESEEGASCPVATQDVTVNLKNRAKAIDAAGYGPENPNIPNRTFWAEKAEGWDVSVDDAKMSRCKNCAAFDQSDEMLQCIDDGIGNEDDASDVVEAGDLGYCEIFDFKCSASRTCDAWIVEGEDEESDDESDEESDSDESEDVPVMMIKIGLKK